MIDEYENQNAIIENIKRILKFKGLNQQELAELIQKSRPNQQGIEPKQQ